MLYQAFFYVLISCICVWSGLIFYSLFPGLGDADPSYRRPLASYFFSGIILLTALGEWFVLVFPLNAWFLLVFILPLLTILSFLLKRRLGAAIKTMRSAQQASPFFISCIGAFIIMILVLNSGPTIMDDTESYHIQMVKWAQEYGTVPGIANLHLRFGFNSSWFIAIALLVPPTAGIDHYITLNGLISIWLCHYLLEKVLIPPYSGRTASNGNFVSGALIVLLFGLFAWPMIRGNATTANYDFISTCIIIILFMETGLTRRPAFSPEWIVWPLFLSTVKLVNVVMLAGSLVSLIMYYNRRSLYAYIAAISLILIPFFLRNLILSGYILYPLYQLDLFAFDWKVPHSLVAELMDFVEYFNRSNGDFNLVKDTPFPNWIPVWHSHLFIYDKVLTDLALLCWIAIAFRWKKLATVFSAQYRIIVLTLFLVLVTWFLVAPDPRFIYGVLLAGIYILVMTMPALPIGRRTVVTGVTFLTSGILVYTLIKIVNNQDYHNWTLPHPLPVPAAQLVTVDGIEMRIPEKVLNNWNPRCFDLPLPCLYTISPFLHARGRHISDGFKMETGNMKEPIRGEFNVEIRH